MRAKKLLSVVLAFVMVMSLLPMSALAVEYSDANDAAWAAKAIDRWSSYGVVRGADGKFRPNANMTRAEAATVFANLLGLTSTEGAQSFADVSADKWYYGAIQKANAAGIINGSYGYMNPDSPVTREMFFTMFARALGFKPQDTTSGAKADGASWSAGYINALTDKGYVKGDGSGVNATANINRASVMTLLDQTISTYANENGKTYEGTGKGVMLVTADDCTITGSIDTLVIAGGEDEAEAVAAAVNADGSITSNLVLAAGRRSIKIENATISNVNVVAPAAVSIGSGATIETVAVTEQAKEVAVEVAEGAKVETVETEAPATEISGSGEVANVAATGAAAAEDAKVEVSTPNTEVKAVATAENADGSKTVTITESKNNNAGKSTGATKTETTVKEEIAADGTKTTETTVTETKTNAAGAVTGTTTTEVKAEEKADGSKVETATQSVTNAAGVTTTTSGTVTTSAAGTVTTTGNNMTAAIAAAETATAAAEAATGETLTNNTDSTGDTGNTGTGTDTGNTGSGTGTGGSTITSGGSAAAPTETTYSVKLTVLDDTTPVAKGTKITLTPTTGTAKSAEADAAGSVTLSLPANVYTVSVDIAGKIMADGSETLAVNGAISNKNLYITADSVSKADICFDNTASTVSKSGVAVTDAVTIYIKNAQNSAGTKLSGTKSVTLTESTLGTIYAAGATFTAGEASIELPAGTFRTAKSGYEITATVEDVYVGNVLYNTTKASDSGKLTLNTVHGVAAFVNVTNTPAGPTGYSASALAVYPTVEVTDVYGNLCTTGSQYKVKMEQGDAKSTWSFTTAPTAVAVSSGTATFTTGAITSTKATEDTGTVKLTVTNNDDSAYSSGSVNTTFTISIPGTEQTVAPTAAFSSKNTTLTVTASGIAEGEKVTVYADAAKATKLAEATYGTAKTGVAFSTNTVTFTFGASGSVVGAVPTSNVYVTRTTNNVESVPAAASGFMVQVTYDLDGGSGSVVSEEVNPASYSGTIKNYDGTKEGYVLGGWSVPGYGTAEPNNTTWAAIAPTSSMTVKAIWYAAASLTYNDNGQTSGTKPSDATSSECADHLNPHVGSVVTIGSYSSPDKTGYDFAGWATTANASAAQYVQGDTITLKAGVNTLYAVWTPKSHVVTLHGNNGTDEDDVTLIFTDGVAMAVGANGFTGTEIDASFAGWTCDDPSGSVSNVVEAGKTLTLSEITSKATDGFTSVTDLWCLWTPTLYDVTVTATGLATTSGADNPGVSLTYHNPWGFDPLTKNAGAWAQSPENPSTGSWASETVTYTMKAPKGDYTFTVQQGSKAKTGTISVPTATTLSLALETAYSVTATLTGVAENTLAILTDGTNVMAKGFNGSSNTATWTGVSAGDYTIYVDGYVVSTPSNGAITVSNANVEQELSASTLSATVAQTDSNWSGLKQGTDVSAAAYDLTVTLTNGKFASTLNKNMFAIDYLPDGVELDSVTRTSDTAATLKFSGAPTKVVNGSEKIDVVTINADAIQNYMWDLDTTAANIDVDVAATIRIDFVTTGGPSGYTVAPQYVSENGYMTALTGDEDPAVDGWQFLGWYSVNEVVAEKLVKVDTSENSGTHISSSTVTITTAAGEQSAKLYGKWIQLTAAAITSEAINEALGTGDLSLTFTAANITVTGDAALNPATNDAVAFSGNVTLSAPVANYGGTLTFNKDVTIPANVEYNHALEIGSQKTLTVQAGATLTMKAVLSGSGTITGVEGAKIVFDNNVPSYSGESSFYDNSGLLTPQKETTYGWKTGVAVANAASETKDGWFAVYENVVSSLSVVKNPSEITDEELLTATQAAWSDDATVSSTGSKLIKISAHDTSNGGTNRKYAMASTWEISVTEGYTFPESDSAKYIIKDTVSGYQTAGAEQCVVLKVTAPEGATTMKLAEFRDPETWSGSASNLTVEDVKDGTDDEGNSFLYWQFFTKDADEHTGYCYIEWIDGEGASLGIDYYLITWPAVE